MNGDTPLHDAVARGNLEMVELLLFAGADIHIGNNAARTPRQARSRPPLPPARAHRLTFAPSPQPLETPLHVARSSAAGRRRRRLTRGVAGVRACGAQMARDTSMLRLMEVPLQIAVLRGSESLVADLLSVGHNPDGPGLLGETPLHLAAALGHTRFIEMLLEAGASVDARDYDGNTPLHYAAGYAQTEARTSPSPETPRMSSLRIS